MESTGVYWIPLYEILERRGIRRRTDWHECQWLQLLHAVGLLRATFRPDGEVCAVRTLLRHRKELVEMASMSSTCTKRLRR